MFVQFGDSGAHETTGTWFGGVDDTSFGWLTHSTASAPRPQAASSAPRPQAGSSAPRRCGVVIVPPIGYEYWTTHRSLRVLAERLAAEGFLVLRLDLRGTGDARGNMWDGAQSVASWRGDVANAVEELRRLGAYSVSLVGLRFGATLAMQPESTLSIDRVVGWLPVVDGKRYARELSMLSTPVPDEASVYGTAARVLAGTVLTDALLSDIAATSLKTPGKPARDVLVVDRDDRPGSATLVDKLRVNAVEVEHVDQPGASAMLDVPTEEATVPDAHIDTIVQYLAPLAATAEVLPRAELTFPNTEVMLESGVRERMITLGPNCLVGIEASPAGPDTDTAVLFLNTGSEPHVGSGRVWVEFSRALAASGTAAIRLDFRGWGESPDDGLAPGRPYDAHTVDDVRDAVLGLRSRYQHVVVVGLCAGAWVGLRNIADLPLDGFVAFNPQLYWQQGDPVEALMSDTRKRRIDEIAEIKTGAITGEWARLEDGAPRCGRGQWIEDLAAAAVPVVLAFSPGDDGIEYLQDRFASRIERATTDPAATLEIRTMDSLDHPMHRHWRRSEGLAVIHAVVDKVRQAKSTATTVLRPDLLASYSA
ncbi:MAG: alpha/beta hydrolase family protein [Rhodococcus sp. (in: high G+C Gram-positive bacteria)]